MTSLANCLEHFATGLQYPQPDYVARLEDGCATIAQENGIAGGHVAQFVSAVKGDTLAQLEERYIETFDMNTASTLDLGWHLFGEDYNRGLFLVKLRQHLRAFNLDETHELPDHISHVLRIIGMMDFASATEFAHTCVLPALEKARRGIKRDNPYQMLIEGLTELLVGSFGAPPAEEETAYVLPIIN